MQTIITAISDSQGHDSIRRTIDNMAAHQRTELQKLVAILIQHDSKFQSLEKKSQDVLCSLFELNTCHIDKRLDDLLSQLELRDQKVLSSLRSFREEFVQEDNRLKFSRVSSCFLDCLRFDQIEMRHAAITKEHARTCEWVLEDSSTTEPWTLFTKWLREDGGIYWVNGKAGSGKSTLMKFIWNHPKTTQLLTEWADNAHLVRAAFFFWNSGAKIQSMQEGLFRSLLYQICRRHHEFFPKAFPDEWEVLSDRASCDREIGKAAPKSLAELKDAFLKVTSCASQSLRMCIFIDGLDEMEGDAMDLTDFMLHVAKSSPYLKVCVSSRPWPVFETSFKGHPSLKMQDLNGDDIRRFTRDKLGRDPNIRSLLGPDPGQVEWLIQEVVSRACGVFLWVCLVVNLLIRGIRDGDNATGLRQRLLSLPEDLELLFQRIIGQIEPIHRAEASQIFQIFRANGNSLDILTMHSALMYAPPQTPEQALKLTVTPSTAFEDPQYRIKLEALVERETRRLNSRCRGLLEVNNGAREFEHLQAPGGLSREELKQLGCSAAPPDVQSGQAVFFRNPDTLCTAVTDDVPAVLGVSRPQMHIPRGSPEQSRSKTDEAPVEHGPLDMSLHEPAWASAMERRRRVIFQISSARKRDSLQVEIQYLHRTARDYLEQPQIWDKILEMSAPFDPKTALVAASLNAVKLSVAVPAPRPNFPTYLRRLDLKPSVTHINLIEELGRAYSARRIEDEIQKLDPHAFNKFVKTWENVGPSHEFKSVSGNDWQGHWLGRVVFEVREKFPWYAPFKEKNHASVVCLSDDQGLPLAFSATAKRIGISSFLAIVLCWADWTTWLSQPSGKPIRWNAKKRLMEGISLFCSVISTLGPGPANCRFRGHTLWEYIITIVHNLSIIHRDEFDRPRLGFRAWLQVFKVMLDNGADPCAACIHDSQEFVDAISMSENWVAPQAVINHMVVPGEDFPSTHYDEEQWRNSNSQLRHCHSVEAVVRDAFLLRGAVGAERLMNLVKRKKTSSEVPMSRGETTEATMEVA